MEEKAQRVHELVTQAKLVFARVVSAAVALLGVSIVGIAVWKLRDTLGTMLLTLFVGGAILIFGILGVLKPERVAIGMG